ncbi:hypothetical protein N7519_010276 [Penicillium mononematosum]|uniref:uncharacterized protein n=1 Tax=Penicillium mononematosum TaxID=268346 RepID=UPI00254781A2|nr:uncharacterized protein N7519_010276 [Penicillium mononematosum]KAJ6179815.1 hypothetical protein N7519_010276 [Penicillium mononematosum]
MAEGADVSGKWRNEDDVPRALIELTMFPYYWKFELGGRGVRVSSCLRAFGMGYRAGILEAEQGTRKPNEHPSWWTNKFLDQP